MYPLFEVIDSFSALNEKAHAMALKIFERLPCEKTKKTVEASDNVLADDLYKKWRLVTSGSFSFYKGVERIWLHEKGDVLGLPHYQNIGEQRIASELPFEVLEVENAALEKCLSESTELQKMWADYFLVHAQLLSLLVSSLLPKADLFQPKVVNFKKGEAIIKQGSKSAEVYSMMNGRAVVTMDGVEVGTVSEDDIFGFIAALTASPRTATVTAQEDCVLLEVSSDHFLELIRSRPAKIFQLLTSMAKAMVGLNSKVIDLTKAP